MGRGKGEVREEAHVRDSCVREFLLYTRTLALERYFDAECMDEVTEGRLRATPRSFLLPRSASDVARTTTPGAPLCLSVGPFISLWPLM